MMTKIGWNTAPLAQASCQADKVVSEWQQTQYLKSSFDILFNQVTLWGESTPAVDKIFWYQYRDVGIPEDIACPLGLNALKGFVPTGYLPDNYPRRRNSQVDTPWWFGLYRGDGSTPKLAQCAFKAYPQRCSRILYLPILQKGRR